MTWRTKLDQMEFDVVPQVGSYVEIDEWEGKGVCLEYDDTEWKLCDFRIPAGGGLYHLATRVEITGHTLQPRNGLFSRDWVRVTVIFVADPPDVDWYTGERLSHDTIVRGWMAVTERERVFNEEKAARLREEWLALLAKREAEEEARQAEQERLALLQAEEKARREQEARKPRSRAAALEL